MTQNLPFPEPSQDHEQNNERASGPAGAERIGLVLGTEDATPTGFWFAVAPGASVQMDDLVTVQTTKPDGSSVRFFGLVDHVRTRHEGVKFD